MKSTLFNMVAVLFTITLIASAAVGGVYVLTEQEIKNQEENAKSEALKNVLPAFDSSEATVVALDGMDITVNEAKADGKVVGYAVESMTKNGFAGEIRMMVGFDVEGNVLNVDVLKQGETPGLGTKMCDEGNPLLASALAVSPADAAKFQVKKDGGELDALTAATISSRAYYDAISRAYRAFCEVSGAAEAPEVVDPMVEAVKALLPEAATVEVVELVVDEQPVKVHVAKSDVVVGYVVESQTDKGYAGVIRLAVAFDAEANVLNVKVAELHETLEQAFELCAEENPLLSSVKSVSPADVEAYRLKSEGGELDALSGATVSTKAYYDAVARAYRALEIANEGFAAQKGGINE